MEKKKSKEKLISFALARGANQISIQNQLLLIKGNEIREREGVYALERESSFNLFSRKTKTPFPFEGRKPEGKQNKSSDGERARPSSAAVQDLVGDGLDRDVLLGREGQGLDGRRGGVLAVAGRSVERELAGAGAAFGLEEERF